MDHIEDRMELKALVDKYATESDGRWWIAERVRPRRYGERAAYGRSP